MNGYKRAGKRYKAKGARKSESSLLKFSVRALSL